MLIGYARVSTDQQGTDPQLDELRSAGCATIREEHASGADRGRPVLARLLRNIRTGETLVVARLGRHRAAEAIGTHFRSLRDPIARPPRKACSRFRCVALLVAGRDSASWIR